MKKVIYFCLGLYFVSGCALLQRHNEIEPPKEQVAPQQEVGRRTTRKSLEEESMLGEQSGSLWVSRGQSSYLFANNNQRLLGDLLNVRIEGYPKEQIQTKVNVISKLLAEILSEQKQDIKLKQEELKKKLTPEGQEQQQEQVQTRGLASLVGAGNPEDENQGPDPKEEIKKNEKQLKKIGEEEGDIQALTKGKEFPIRSIPTRIVEIQKDGNLRVRGEQPFMIGKREYKLLVVGTVRSEDYDEKGLSAEALLDPVFDIISDKKSEAL